MSVSDAQKVTEWDINDDPPVSVSGSLDARMKATREGVEAKETEIFPIPGKFEDVVAVELRVMGWERLRKIGARSKGIRNEAIQELYVACDQMVAATVGFHEITEAPDGSTIYERAEGETWQSLAHKGVLRLPDDLTARMAMLALIKPDQLILTKLYTAWNEWQSTRKPDTDREVVADFSTTE